MDTSYVDLQLFAHTYNCLYIFINIFMYVCMYVCIYYISYSVEKYEVCSVIIGALIELV